MKGCLVIISLVSQTTEPVLHHSLQQTYSIQFPKRKYNQFQTLVERQMDQQFLLEYVVTAIY